MRQWYHTYKLGRFHIAASRDLSSPEAKREFVLTSLQYDGTVAPPHTKFEWGFFNVESAWVEEWELLTGDLVKFEATPAGAEVVDKDRHRVQMLVVNNRVVAKSRFYLDIPSGLIAFHLPEKGISVLQFPDYFCRLFKEANDVFCHPELDMVTEEERILAYMSRFKAVTSVTVTLRPSNPNFRPVWEPIDNEMKGNRATRYKAEYSSNKPEGLKIPVEGDSLYNHILMAEDGYGDAKVVGTTEGDQKKTVTTKRQATSARVPAAADKPTVAKTISEKFHQLLERLKR